MPAHDLNVWAGDHLGKYEALPDRQWCEYPGETPPPTTGPAPPGHFAGTTSLGRSTVSPFNVNGNLPNPGSFGLTAVATAGGLSATSAVVSISVVAPSAVSLTPPTLSGGNFGFDYNVNPGLRYVVEGATSLGGANLPNWVSLTTNVPATSPAHFSEPAANSLRFYRVGRLPNP